MKPFFIEKLFKLILCIGLIVIFIFSFILMFISYRSGGTKVFRNPEIVGIEESRKPDNIDELVRGKIGYNIPDTMEIDKYYKAIVTISKALDDSILFMSLNNIGFIEGEIMISSRVKVILKDPTGDKNETPSGKNFEINALSTEEQLVDDILNTKWNWNIRPKRAGQNYLMLNVTVKVLDYLGENYRDIGVFEKKIKVKSSGIFTIKKFISDYWQFLLTACVIPLLVFGYKKFNERGKKNDKPKPIGFKG